MPPEDEPEDIHGECAAEIHALTQKLEAKQHEFKIMALAMEDLARKLETVQRERDEAKKAVEGLIKALEATAQERDGLRWNMAHLSERHESDSEQVRVANLQVEAMRVVLGLVQQAAHQDEWYDSMGIQQDAYQAVHDALENIGSNKRVEERRSCGAQIEGGRCAFFWPCKEHCGDRDGGSVCKLAPGHGGVCEDGMYVWNWKPTIGRS